MTQDEAFQRTLLRKLSGLGARLYTITTPVSELFRFVRMCQDEFILTEDDFTELLDMVIKRLREGESNGKEAPTVQAEASGTSGDT